MSKWVQPGRPKIVTHYCYPPIPWRRFDWCAYRDGEEERGNYGWGATEREAISDLLNNEEEAHGRPNPA